ncbi:MAG: hypothetical protein ACPG40_08965 [Alphaproteobacteria bacterium]
MSGKRVVIEITFAASLRDHREKTAVQTCFVTPATALKTHGVLWALELQGAVDQWREGTELIVDVSQAPGYGLKAMQLGLRSVFYPKDQPAYEDLAAYAKALGASLYSHMPDVVESWNPNVPHRRRKPRQPTTQTSVRESRKNGHDG